VINVLAEDDGLGEAIGGPEKLGDLGGNELGALFEDEVSVVVEVVVFAVLDLVAELVYLPFPDASVESLSIPIRTTLYGARKPSDMPCLSE